ncbi:conserved hypothetical protein [Desulfamplus magnetovallimortis]|uniref:Chemotaxis phosphatase CheX-like domain-containing protein n=1 Tax=Desulfamplus magnetovallimortis TaxID=1246637 RepID=A0A1W1H7A4_9BACT|nr:chemotaxis protein CheX [Desulfamplus magnetovallimortis]SLM28347.1 conserved hypothetical protein [Desulfamplus magnetovallimortis]
MAISMNELINIISERLEGFFKDELDIIVDDREKGIIPMHRLGLRYLTTVINISGSININVIFSYEKRLIEKIFEIYTEDVEILPEERLEYIEETAGDIINIIVGNSTADFESSSSLTLSPPIMISEAKSIAKSKTSEFFVNHLHTSYGTMTIFCVGPKNVTEGFVLPECEDKNLEEN